MAGTMRDLKVWQEAVALAGDVTRCVHGCSRRETRQLTDRLLHTALDVASRVADGSSRPGAAERAHLFREARSSLAILDTHLAIGRAAGLIPAAALGPLTTRSGIVGRLLGGYLALAERLDERSA